MPPDMEVQTQLIDAIQQLHNEVKEFFETLGLDKLYYPKLSSRDDQMAAATAQTLAYVERSSGDPRISAKDRFARP
jgi:hypothetical protein